MDADSVDQSHLIEFPYVGHQLADLIGTGGGTQTHLERLKMHKRR